MTATSDHRFCSHKSGATIIEFAVVAPVLFLLLTGILEFTLIFLTAAILEGATNFSARVGKTGYYDASQAGSREQYIRSRVHELSGGYLSTRILNIEMLSYDNFENIGQPEPCILPPKPPCPGQPGVNFIDVNGNGQWDTDMGKSGPGVRGEVVFYRVTYPWQLFTPLVSNLISGGTGILNITTVAAVKNERF